MESRRDAPEILEGSCSVKLIWGAELAPRAKRNWATVLPLWVPLLPLLSWYLSSLVFLAQALRVPCLLARGAERQVASWALHRHRHSGLARCNMAHSLAVSCRAPCSLGVQVDFWNVTERETKLFIESPSHSSNVCLGMQDAVLRMGGKAEAFCTSDHVNSGLLLFFRQVCNRTLQRQLHWKHHKNGNTRCGTYYLPL